MPLLGLPVTLSIIGLHSALRYAESYRQAPSSDRHCRRQNIQGGPKKVATTKLSKHRIKSY